MNDFIPLAQAHCLARHGSEHRLPEARIRELLLDVPGWDLVIDPVSSQGQALTRTFGFEN